MSSFYGREGSGRLHGLCRHLQRRAGNAAALWLARRLRGTTESKARRLGAITARLLPTLSPRHRRIVLTNLRLAFGREKSEEEIRRLVAGFYHHIGRCFAEFIRLPALSREELLRLVSLEGEEHVRQGLAAGRGVILLTGHVGNWELTGARIAAAGFPLNVIAREQREADLTDFITGTREKTGMRVIPRETAVRRTLAALRRNELVGILSDQNAGEEGIFVDFFGHLASTPAGPAAFALRTGAAVIPVFGRRRRDDTHRVVFLPRVEVSRSGDRERDLRENTARFTKIIEEAIRREPSQWFWLHKRWKARPSPE